MFTPAELQLDPDKTKGMTADEQREMIQKIYNEQVRAESFKASTHTEY